jgi:hypothetical protein
MRGEKDDEVWRIRRVHPKANADVTHLSTSDVDDFAGQQRW